MVGSHNQPNNGATLAKSAAHMTNSQHWSSSGMLYGLCDINISLIELLSIIYFDHSLQNIDVDVCINIRK